MKPFLIALALFCYLSSPVSAFDKTMASKHPADNKNVQSKSVLSKEIDKKINSNIQSNFLNANSAWYGQLASPSLVNVNFSENAAGR